MSQSFAYHSEEEFTHSQSYKYTETVTWPHECPAGFQLTYTMEEITEDQELPVQLIFERSGVQWTEVSWMKASLQKIIVTKDDCCIYQDADPSCDSETLEMCPNSFLADADRVEYPLGGPFGEE